MRGQIDDRSRKLLSEDARRLNSIERALNPDIHHHQIGTAFTRVLHSGLGRGRDRIGVIPQIDQSALQILG